MEAAVETPWMASRRVSQKSSQSMSRIEPESVITSYIVICKQQCSWLMGQQLITLITFFANKVINAGFTRTVEK